VCSGQIQQAHLVYSHDSHHSYRSIGRCDAHYPQSGHAYLTVNVHIRLPHNVQLFPTLDILACNFQSITLSNTPQPPVSPIPLCHNVNQPLNPLVFNLLRRPSGHRPPKRHQLSSSCSVLSSTLHLSSASSRCATGIYHLLRLPLQHRRRRSTYSTTCD
jgi:hypothetical protein